MLTIASMTNFIDNTRYHTCPPFGQDTIRRFTGSVSNMANLAAQDYEDMLQVSSSILVYL